jgi:signal transduction histidine kinase
MTIPLRANGRVEGILEFASVDAGAFTVDHDGIAREVADQLAIAVSQARLRAELIDQARELEERLDDLRRTDQHRRTLLARVVSAQEEERRRIAEDIHDDPVQIMTAVGMRLDLLKARLTDDADRAAVTTLAQTVVQAIARLRGLLFELAPQVLERRGVAAAVRNYVDQRMSEGRVQVEVISRLSEEPSYETRVVVYRNIQAALANVRAHSLAAHVRVTIEPREGVLARVEDDGVGFDVGAAPEDELGHLGLTSMRERAELAGGWFRVESERGHGTTVEFWVPELAEPAAVAAT